MTQIQFTKAVKYDSKLRLALMGPSGSGKTYSALRIASLLGKNVAVLDTEFGSASLYADRFDFSVMELTSFAPENYIAAVIAAEKAGFDVLVIDSLSHAWAGKDGILEFVDRKTADSRAKNSYTSGWSAGTPLQNRMVDTIKACGMHVVCTMRSKTEYIMVKDDRGKDAPKKIGMAPIQRDNLEYEFDIIGDMTMEHDLVVVKSRCDLVDGAVFPLPGENFIEPVKAWLTGQADPRPKRVVEAAPAAVPATQYPSPAHVLTKELEEARARVIKQLTTMKNAGIYADWDVVREEMNACLGVRNLSDAWDIDGLTAYYTGLVKRERGDTPFSPVTPEATPAAVVAESPAAPTDTPTPTPTADVAPVQDTPTVVDAAQEDPDDLRDQIDKEISARKMTEAEADYYAKSALETSSVSMLTTLLGIVKAHSLKAATVPVETKNLQDEIKRLHQILVNGNIDGWGDSSRMSQAVQEHLGVKTLPTCKDPQKLAAYIIYLSGIINSKEEVVA